MTNVRLTVVREKAAIAQSVPPAGTDDYLRARQVLIAYAGRSGDAVLAIDRVDFTLSRGEFVCLVGPSGCGKTTFLNAVAGFLPISSGALTLNGKPIVRPGPERAMVFQQPGLLPWRDVLRNVTYGLEMSGRMRGRAAAAHARALLELVGLADFAHSFPHKRIPSLIAGLVVQDSYIKAHPKIVQAAVNATVEAIHRERTDKAFAQKEIRKYMHVTQQAVLDFTYDFYANEAAPLAMPKASELTVARDALSVTDPKVKNLDLSSLIDQSFVREAEKRLNMK